MKKYQLIPSLITWFRIGLIPLLLLSFFVQWEYANWLNFSIFLAAGISDGLDGWFARRWSVTSLFGSFFDPVADKLMVCTSMILLTVQYNDTVLTIASIVIIIREIVVSSLREWNAQNFHTDKIPVSVFGKIKTFLQFFAISFLFIGETVWLIDSVLIGYWLLFFSIVLSLFSMGQYLMRGHYIFKNREDSLKSGSSD